jgi:hypothetical protein
MSAYEPPTAEYPIFDSLAFQAPNSASLTLAEADQRYLARQNIATSNASLTSFAGDITIGNSILDYTAGNGLFIRTTANGESMYLRTLSAGGATLQKIELNPTHMHLYGNIRITDSAAPSKYTNFTQNDNAFSISNVVNNSRVSFELKTSGGVDVEALVITPTQLIMNVPLSLGYTTTPAAGQLGFRTKTAATASTAISTNTVITLITGGFSLSAGTYIITLNGHITTTAVAGSVTSYELGISTANNSFTGGFSDTVLGSYAVPASGIITGQCTEVLNVTGAIPTTYFFNHRLIFATIVPSVSTANTFIQYTRIA